MHKLRKHIIALMGVWIVAVTLVILNQDVGAQGLGGMQQFAYAPMTLPVGFFYRFNVTPIGRENKECHVMVQIFDGDGNMLAAERFDLMAGDAESFNLRLGSRASEIFVRPEVNSKPNGRAVSLGEVINEVTGVTCWVHYPSPGL
ncbi:MAG: hypothetical protein ACREOW_03295 [Thermodesulfobacteriota bacterium]